MRPLDPNKHHHEHNENQLGSGSRQSHGEKGDNHSPHKKHIFPVPIFGSKSQCQITNRSIRIFSFFLCQFTRSKKHHTKRPNECQ